jgi:hypothetical protein
VAIVIGAVLVANAPALLGFVHPNPLNLDSGLGVITRGGLIPGRPTLDPNDGWTAQALGHLAALDWLHGHVPWWNPYEGLGSPLAGEMQSAAFFPPTLLLVFSTGQLYSHALLEVVGGVATYFFLVRLVRTRAAAVVGAVAFALNGTMAWFGHAPSNPVALLPLLLLGVERAREAAVAGRPGRWGLMAVAGALSLYAGFPETAYVDAIFVVIWAFVRLPDLDRVVMLRYARKLAAGAGITLALAAPIIVAFLDYLPHADVGAHAAGFTHSSLPRVGAPGLLMPYVYGAPDAYIPSEHTGTLLIWWGNVGGYMSALLLFLAFIGLVGRSLRPARLALGLWVAVSVGRTFGVPVLAQAVNALPYMRHVAFFRYADASWEMAIVILATLGLDALLARDAPVWSIGASWLITVVVVVVAIRRAQAFSHHFVGAGAAGHETWLIVSAAWALGSVTAAALLIVLPVGLYGRLVVGGMVGLEAVAFFAVPELTAPRAAHIDTAVVVYLQRHLGTQRFVTLGPVAPDYGSYWQVSSLSLKDLPVPKAYADALASLPRSPVKGHAAPSGGAEIVAQLSGYEALGVRYVLVPASAAPDLGPPLRLVYADDTAKVYRLPAATPLYRTTGSACTVRRSSLSAVRVDCARPALLIRNELDMPGWSASVNGRPVAVRSRRGLVQSVALPTGTSSVRFAFVPPYEDEAAIALVVGVVVLEATLVRWRPVLRSGRHSRHRAGAARTNRTAGR